MPRQTTQCAVLASELLHAQVGFKGVSVPKCALTPLSYSRESTSTWRLAMQACTCTITFTDIWTFGLGSPPASPSTMQPLWPKTNSHLCPKTNCRTVPKQNVALSLCTVRTSNTSRYGRTGSQYSCCHALTATMALPMLLAQNRSLKFGRQKNHKNSLLALSSYIFFFTYLSERRAPLETVKFRDLR